MQTPRFWDHVILDANPPLADAGALAVGDIDGDGRDELVIGGDGALLWYRVDGAERGVLAEGIFSVGLAIADLDGDGRAEILAAEQDPATSTWMISWFRHPGANGGLWDRHTIDPACTGNPHDIIAVDIDADGRLEVVANAAYTANPGVFLYRPGESITAPWVKHAASHGYFAEGLSVGDLNGDGTLEIVHGPDYFVAPPEGAFSGPWERRVYAPNLREMTRTAVIDVSGDGLADVIAVESEYPDGRLSWFENRGEEGGDVVWYEHRLEDRLNFCHSLDVWLDADRAVHVFVAEMAKGGWDAPYNYDARLLEYVTTDRGDSWRRDVISQGQGTHQALMRDVLGDGRRMVVGKEWGRVLGLSRVHLWRERDGVAPLALWRHTLLDRDKPTPATDIICADVDDDDYGDVLCGAWWYRNPGWTRRALPGVAQVLLAYDLDGDGRDEVIATRRVEGGAGPAHLSNALCWLKPSDAVAGEWEVFDIGVGAGDWPHGACVAPLLPGGRLALVVGYHSAGKGDRPELWEIPADPRGQWTRRTLADIPYGEEFVAADLDGDGLVDLVAGPYWLRNQGDGTFAVVTLIEGYHAARAAVADVNGDGRLDVILGEEVLDFEKRVTPWSRVIWLEQPADPLQGAWQVHTVDKVRCAHSLDVADLDGDGVAEIVVGEHDPFRPYRSRCHLYVYQRAEPSGLAWRRYLVDDRFEHHDGAQVVELEPGRKGIVSHGWKDLKYVHLWEPMG